MFSAVDGQSYDQHLNMVLGDVEETVTTVEVDEDTFEEIVRVRMRIVYSPVLYFVCLHGGG